MAKVKALSRIKHDGVVYEKDQVFEVTDRQAKDLKEAGVVKVGKDYRDPDKAKPEELDEAEPDTTDAAPADPTADGTKTPDQLAQG